MLERVNIYVEKSNWDYLGQLAEVLEKNRSEIARDIISLYVANLKKVFGENCQNSKAGIIEFYGAMLSAPGQGINAVAVKDFAEDDFEFEVENEASQKNNGAKVGRNGKCPCGSGRKYKNCCGK